MYDDTPPLQHVSGIDLPVFSARERLRYDEELRQARHVAEQACERLRATLDTIGDGVLALDNDDHIVYMNPAAAALCACDWAAAAGLPLSAVFDPRDDATGHPFALDAAGPDVHWTLQARGRALSLTVSVMPMLDGEGDPLGALLVLHDESAAREYERRLHNLATRDPLTSLINRREFERRLALALGAGQAEGHTLMYLDLDQFKIVNDTCGHAAGDELMRQFAHVMQMTLRRHDLLARLGGDEFGVLVQRGDPAEALALAERLRQAAAEFDYAWAGKAFPIGLSIGLVHLVPGVMQAEEALRLADSACCVAKEKGRNRVQVSTCDGDVERHTGAVGWISRLHAALKEDRFVLFGQRIRAMHPDHEHADHVEVLIRLRETDGALVSPMAFIPSAERFGLMPKIDRWVVSSLLARLHGLQAPGARPALYAVNLSGATLCDDGFLPFVRAELARHGVDPRRLCFEVTETAAIANLQQATAMMTALRALGCRFSLDDFGSGMSSFGYLRHLPVDFLKIDGRFVKGLAGDPVNQAMVEAINRVGHVMGLATIAEFVESGETLDCLARIGVDFCQGYEVHVPQPL